MSDTDSITWSDDEVDAFVRHYKISALWSSTDNADDSGGEPLDRKHDEDDIAEPTAAKMREDCLDFIKGNQRPLDQAIELILSGSTNVRFESEDFRREAVTQLAHDFWLTRNGHGAGFWDRGLGTLGDLLTSACRPYGEYNLYVGDDGKIHGD